MNPAVEHRTPHIEARTLNAPRAEPKWLARIVKEWRWYLATPFGCEVAARRMAKR